MRRIAFVFLNSLLLAAGQGDHTRWSDYGGAADSAQYSALKQINRSNIKNLKVAWSYSTGDNNKYSFNPLIANGRLYVLARNNSIIALDATTGKEVWVHEVVPHTKLITSRGINYWESKDGNDRRLFFAADNLLQSIDARTGEAILSFGTHGRVDLREGFGRDPQTLTLVQSTTPGRVFENLLILGSATNQGYGSAPGDIRAFDVRTGKLVWTFHTVPHPGEFGYDTWPANAWKTVGGANSWSELTLDVRRGIVYIPTASPKYNFYGVDRKGANLFGDCLLALDARTGKRLWHFQMVHHDIWDYDNPTAPQLLTIRHNEKSMDIVAQVGKEGFVWVFNRVTGEPVWPIEERPVPHSDMPGEETWPTQPFPSKPPPFARQKFTADDLNSFMSPEERAQFRDKMESARNEGMFTPPGVRNTVQMPGNNGGANWGGAAIDPAKGTLYVASKDLPAMLKLERHDQTEPTRYYSGFGFMLTRSGFSPITPPWASLTAYDLNEGTIKWKIPLGGVPSLTAKGFNNTGVHFLKGGPVITAGGLLFTATRDRKVRAFDEENGKLLWEAELEAGSEGVPAVYEAGGREYLVVCAAAQSDIDPSSKSAIHGAYVAFALDTEPQTK